MAQQDLSGEKSFLGRDFLTWLWFRCEVEGGEFELGDILGVKDGSNGATAVMVEDALALVSAEEDGSVMTLRKGSPTARPEAASALAAGMALKKARLFVARGSREWQFTLDGETLDLGSVKTPDTDEPEAEADEKESTDPEAVTKKKARKSEASDALDELAEKLLAAEEAREIVEALFRQFLEVRLTRDWEKIELPRMCDWVGTKLDKAAVEIGSHG